MATTLTAATLTVKHTESISLNGQDQGATNTLTIASVAEIYKRIVTCPASEITLISIGDAAANVGPGTFVEGDVKYIRLTNKDDTNHISLVFKNEDNDEFQVKLDKGQSFIFNGDLSGGLEDTIEGNAGAVTPGNYGTNGDLLEITATADTAACDLEIFVAST